MQSIEGHLKGGIPSEDVESLSLYWETFPKLQSALYTPVRRKKFYSLAVGKDTIRNTIDKDADFSAYADKVETAFESWKAKADKKLRAISNKTKPKLLIAELAELMIQKYESVTLLDKYDAYEVLLSYWNETMSDDVYLIVQDGYQAVREVEVFTKTTENKKTGKKKTTETGWDGRLVPKDLVIEMCFSGERKAIDNIDTIIATKQAELDEMIENAEEDSIINDVLKDNGNLDKAGLKKKLRDKELDANDEVVLQKLQDTITSVDEYTKILKNLRATLDQNARDQYPKLTDKQMMELLLNRKWYCSLINGIYALYNAVNHRISDRVTELADRYEQTMPELETQVAQLEAKVKSHLERMGFAW